jgi:hypothetical protein
MITHNGKTLSLHLWTKEPEVVALGMSRSFIYKRVRELWWDPIKALTTPKTKRHSRIKMMADRAGMHYQTVYARLKLGWGEEDALTHPVRGYSKDKKPDNKIYF